MLKATICYNSIYKHRISLHCHLHDHSVKTLHAQNVLQTPGRITGKEHFRGATPDWCSHLAMASAISHATWCLYSLTTVATYDSVRVNQLFLRAVDSYRRNIQDIDTCCVDILRLRCTISHAAHRCLFIIPGNKVIF